MVSRSRRTAPSRVLHVPVLLLLFVLSGCAALIYQIVWLQLLELVVGSSALSLGVLLGTFMGGMCLGSVLLARLVGPQVHPLKVYAVLELGIGAGGLLLLAGMPLVEQLYVLAGAGLTARALVAALCLLPPTMLMGATLPAIARWVDTTPAGVAWLGFFYGGNIGGGVVGALVAGFYLLRVFDVGVATVAAAALNVVVAIGAIWLAARTVYAPGMTAAAQASSGPGQRSPAVFVAIGLSGLTALVSEVIWTRLLSLTVGATVYAFSLILAAFLFGLGVGSTLGASLARRTTAPRALFGWCQLLLAGAMAWAAWLLAAYLPYVATAPSAGPWAFLGIDLGRCLTVVLPGAILWGASFPLALAASAMPGQDPGRLVGGVYAANTVGAIAGALGGVVLAGTIGSQHTQQITITVAAISGVLLLASPSSRLAAGRQRSARFALVAGVVIAGVLAWSVAPLPGVLIAYGRNAATWVGATRIIYAGEGLSTFVAVSRTPSGAPVYHAAGKVQASGEGEDLRLQRMLAHFSHLVPARPADVLVIGLGAGATAGAIAMAPGVERVTVVEIERLVPPLSRYFADYNYDVADNPKVRVRIDDGRHYLMTSRDTFDVITSDLVDPWLKGTATLFTREFFAAAKQRLNPGGVVTLFVQLYMSNRDSVKSEIATFMDVFPGALVWGNTREGQGYDLVLIGQNGPSTIDVDAWQARLDRPDHAAVAQSLREIGFGSAVELLSTFAGSAPQLAPWLHDAVITRDRNLRLQFLAGLSADVQQSGPIYAEMVRHVTFPDGLFRGSPAALAAVRAGIARATAQAMDPVSGGHP